MGKNPFPNRPVEVRLAASKKGVQMRQKRAMLKRQIKRGEISVTDILRNPPDFSLKIRALELVKSVPGIGQARAMRILRENGINERRRIQGLGQRQKGVLIDYFQ